MNASDRLLRRLESAEWRPTLVYVCWVNMERGIPGRSEVIPYYLGLWRAQKLRAAHPFWFVWCEEEGESEL